MNAINLMLPEGTLSNVWFCGECKALHRQRDHADACCGPVPCRICGEPVPGEKMTYVNRGLTHSPCWAADRQREDAERLAKAEHVETWDGWVWTEGHGGNNGFFESLEEYVDFLEGDREPADWPEWVWTCDPVPFPGISAGDIIEHLTDDMFEDAEDHLTGKAELEAACEAFNEANKGVVSYEANRKRAVRVPRPVAAGGPTP